MDKGTVFSLKHIPGQQWQFKTLYSLKVSRYQRLPLRQLDFRPGGQSSAPYYDGAMTSVCLPTVSPSRRLMGRKSPRFKVEKTVWSSISNLVLRQTALYGRPVRLARSALRNYLQGRPTPRELDRGDLSFHRRSDAGFGNE
jgi:hypothetical protein